MATPPSESNLTETEVVIGYPVGSAACPYGVPPPPPSSARSNHHRRTLSKFEYYCRLVSFFVTILVPLTLFFAFLIYALICSFNGNLIHYPEIQVLDAAVTSFNASAVDGGGVYITGRWNMTLLIKNPNTKASISYLTLRAKFWYDSYYDDVASTRVHPLFQHALNETRVGVQFVSENQYMKLNGDDDEEFGITVFVKFEVNGYEDTKRMYSVDCYPIRMRHLANASSNKPCVASNHNVEENFE